MNKRKCVHILSVQSVSEISAKSLEPISRSEPARERFPAKGALRTVDHKKNRASPLPEIHRNEFLPLDISPSSHNRTVTYNEPTWVVPSQITIVFAMAQFADAIGNILQPTFLHRIFRPGKKSRKALSTLQHFARSQLQCRLLTIP
jgi:hypothetical protein